MRVCIGLQYGGGATKRIVSWITEGVEALGNVVDLRKTWEVENFNYDLFIVGSPTYWEKPMKSVVDFVSSHREELEGRSVAVFIVHLAKVLGRFSRKYVEEHCLKLLEKEALRHIVGKADFRGDLGNQTTSKEKSAWNE